MVNLHTACVIEDNLWCISGIINSWRQALVKTDGHIGSSRSQKKDDVCVKFSVVVDQYMFTCTAARVLGKKVWFLMKEPEWRKQQKGEEERYFWLHSRMCWRGWRQLTICTFCHILSLSFCSKWCHRWAQLVHKDTRFSKHTCINRKKGLLPHWIHTSSPSHPHPLSSQRQKDIFIFHETLMKHLRHKIHFHDFSNVVPTAAAAVSEGSICCGERELSQRMSVKTTLAVCGAVQSKSLVENGHLIMS